MSADAQALASVPGSGRTRVEAIRRAVEEAAAAYGDSDAAIFPL